MVFSNNELSVVSWMFWRFWSFVGKLSSSTRWWQLKHVLFSSQTLGRWSNLTNIFQRGWNHQLDHLQRIVNMGIWKTSFFSWIFFRQDCNPVDGNLTVTFFPGASFPTPKSFPKNHGISSHWWFGDPGILLYRVKPCQTLLFLKCLMVLRVLTKQNQQDLVRDEVFLSYTTHQKRYSLFSLYGVLPLSYTHKLFQPWVSMATKQKSLFLTAGPVVPPNIP